MVEKTQTGIKNFDKLLSGGFPAGSTILLSGTPGTGKTIFALEFLYRGATKFDENGLFITFEEKEDFLINQARQFGWDLGSVKKKLQIISIPISELSQTTMKDIKKIIKKNNIKRLVIDSISALLINTPTIHGDFSKVNDFIIKRFIYSFINELRQTTDVTSLLITQAPDEKSFSIDNVSEYVCDGIVHITYESMGGAYSRSLIVRKMRQVKNDEDIHPLEISKSGIVIHDLK